MKCKRRTVGSEISEINTFFIGFPLERFLLMLTFKLNNIIKNFDTILVTAVTTTVRDNLCNIFKYFFNNIMIIILIISEIEEQSYSSFVFLVHQWSKLKISDFDRKILKNF